MPTPGPRFPGAPVRPSPYGAPGQPPGPRGGFPSGPPRPGQPSPAPGGPPRPGPGPQAPSRTPPRRPLPTALSNPHTPHYLPNFIIWPMHNCTDTARSMCSIYSTPSIGPPPRPPACVPHRRPLRACMLALHAPCSLVHHRCPSPIFSASTAPVKRSRSRREPHAPEPLALRDITGLLMCSGRRAATRSACTRRPSTPPARCTWGIPIPRPRAARSATCPRGNAGS